MSNGDLTRYKDMLSAKRLEILKGGGRMESIRASGERLSDPSDVATAEIDTATEARLKETDGKLLRAIEDALARIRGDKYGICEECGEPISRPRLEAVPWTRWCRDCKAREDAKN